MNSLLRYPLPFVALIGLACAPEEGAACGDFASQSNAIKFAEADAGLDPVPAAQAIFALHWQTIEDDEPMLACTATRIGRGEFLTAKHCIPEQSAASADSPTGEDATTLLLSCTVLDSNSAEPCGAASPLRVQAVELHDALDIALLHSDDDHNYSAAASMSLPTNTAANEQPLFVAGFGLTEDATLGELRALPASLQQSAEQRLEVQANAGGACVGDSGGPLYSVAKDASGATLFGVLSTGSATCLKTDVYIDVKALLPWLDQVR